jgi:hypothetical protein
MDIQSGAIKKRQGDAPASDESPSFYQASGVAHRLAG